MKYSNPTLITLNNTLHIKADNLEPVEVDSSCVRELMKHIDYQYYISSDLRSNIDYQLTKGINISELSDRIEVRKCYAQQQDSEVDIEYYRVFLLPAKELSDTTIMLNKLDSLKERKIIESIWLTEPTKAKGNYTITFSQNDKPSPELLEELKRLEKAPYIEPIDSTTYHNPRYTIEEIEMAIDKVDCNIIVKAMFKKDVINNLKK